MQIETSEGLHVEPTRATIKAGDSPDMQLRIAAAPNGRLGGLSRLCPRYPRNRRADFGDYYRPSCLAVKRIENHRQREWDAGLEGRIGDPSPLLNN